MELIIDPKSGTTLSFPNREHRNQNEVNFNASEVKKIHLSNVTYTVDGATGDILIRCKPEQYIRDYVESHAREINGYYPNVPSLSGTVLDSLLDDTQLLTYGGVKIEDGMTVHEFITRGGDISSLL